MSENGSTEPTGRTMPVLGTRFEAAVRVAIDLHRSQPRKGTTIPYVSHLLAVCSLVLEAGGTEDEAMAALLHDAVEDQGGPPTLGHIREHFGDDVAAIVEACSATGEGDDTSSPARKRAYVQHLDQDSTSRSALLVSAADKLHNLRSILRDHREDGADLWTRFNVGPADQASYYTTLAEVYRRRLGGGILVDELEGLSRQLEAIVDPTKLEWARVALMSDCAFAGLGDPSAINAEPSVEPTRSGWFQRDRGGHGMAFGFAEVDGLPVEIGLAGRAVIAARLEFVDDVDELTQRGEGSWVPLGRFRCDRVFAIDQKHPDRDGYCFDLSLPPGVYRAEVFRSGSDAVGLRLVPG